MKVIALTAMFLCTGLYLYNNGCSDSVSNDPVVIQRQVAAARADAEWHRLIKESCRTSQEGQVVQSQIALASDKAKLAEERTRLLAAERALREELAKVPANTESTTTSAQ